jgi:hypothetical protein
MIALIPRSQSIPCEDHTMPLSSELTLLKNAPLEFMTKYSVSPPNLYNGGQLPGGGNAGPTPFGALRGRNEMDALLMIRDEYRLAYSSLERSGAESYDLKIYADSQLAGPQKLNLLPVWYLPWRADRVTKIHIPVGIAGDGSPSLFFTSALSGCSVFVKGAPSAPMVYHAGTGEGRDPATLLAGTTPQHWVALFDRYSPNTPNRVEVNKTHYMGDETATVDLAAYMNFLKNTAKGNVVICSLQGAATVFGIRDAAMNWSFYLQQKVQVKYRTFTMKRKYIVVGAKERILAAEKTYLRPMQVTKIYPGGPGHAKLWNAEPFVVPA